MGEDVEFCKMHFYYLFEFFFTFLFLKKINKTCLNKYKQPFIRPPSFVALLLLISCCLQFFRTETWAQFHQRSTYSFYERRSRMRNKTVKSALSFYAFGLRKRKSCTLNVDEIDPRCQFHQRSTSSFCDSRSQKSKKILTT